MIRQLFHGEEVKRMAKETRKPGERDGDSGQYVRVGPRGGQRGPEETTHVEGKPFPPTPKPGEQWKPVDPTRHKK
jgi:hypothetical protein